MLIVLQIKKDWETDERFFVWTSFHIIIGLIIPIPARQQLWIAVVSLTLFGHSASNSEWRRKAK